MNAREKTKKKRKTNKQKRNIKFYFPEKKRVREHKNIEWKQNSKNKPLN